MPASITSHLLCPRSPAACSTQAELRSTQKPLVCDVVAALTATDFSNRLPRGSDLPDLSLPLPQCRRPSSYASGVDHMGDFGISQPVLRREDPRLLTGNGRFVDDISPAGTLHAVAIRSPHAHANIRSIETAAARTAPGVHAVYTAGDLAADGRSEEHTSELQSLMRTSYAVFCL